MAIPIIVHARFPPCLDEMSSLTISNPMMISFYHQSFYGFKPCRSESGTKPLTALDRMAQSWTISSRDLTGIFLFS